MKYSKPRLLLGSSLFILILAALIFAVSFRKSFFPKSCKNCNVILISLDTLRGDALPCYGYSRNTAPNLCKFASENILFQNSYANAESTLPSHFSIFTSLYPSSHQVTQVFKFSLNPQISTLPQVLKAAGYQTILVGPQNDQNLPLDRGIERGFNQIFSDDFDSMNEWKIGLTKLLENQKENKPTFLFLHTYDIHSPYIIEPHDYLNPEKRMFTNDYFPQIPTTAAGFKSFDQKFFDSILLSLKNRITAGGSDESIQIDKDYYQKLISSKTLEQAQQVFETFPDSEIYDFRANRYFQSVDIKNPKQVEYFRALYDEGIYEADNLLAPLFNFLKTNGLMNNTIVIITADHGEEFMEHGNLGHGGSLYNHTAAVPLIMSVPGVKERKISNLAQGIDIYPTILGLLGTKAPPWIEGTDLTGLIYKRPFAKSNKYVVSEGYALLVQSIRDGRWELQKFEDGKIELFDLKNDPDEKNNLADKRPDIVFVLGAQMDRILAKKPNFPPIDIGLPKWIDETKRQRLEKSGYF